MGKAFAIYKIYPEEGFTIDQIMDSLKKFEKIKSMQKLPIGFGVELLKIGVIMDDKLDSPETIEQEIKGTPGIKEMECDDITLIS